MRRHHMLHRRSLLAAALAAPNGLVADPFNAMRNL